MRSAHSLVRPFARVARAMAPPLGAAALALAAASAPAIAGGSERAVAASDVAPRLRLVPAPDGEGSGAGRGARHDAVVLDAAFDVDVRGMLARLRLVQRFRNDVDGWRDATYAFPLPDGATVTGLLVRAGERTIRGAVRERDEASARFEAAAADGRIAAIVDRHRPNLFETRIASIGPGETVEVTLDVLLPVSVDDDVYRLVLPTTLTPRYVNADVADAAALGSPVLPASRTRGPRFRLDVRVAGIDAGALASPSHRLTPDAGGDARVEAGTARVAGPADRDVTLEWPAASGAEPDVHVHVGTRAGARYVQLLLEPPARERAPEDGAASGPPPPRPRELVIVLDRSGSMAGEPMRAARAAVESALDRLGPRDTFNVIAFDDRVSQAFDAPRPADARAISDARDFVRRIDADGGTEIRPALERAIATSDPERLVQIVFVTDGAIGYEDALLADIEASLGGRRLFTVGIGAAPNRWFLDKAATLGRGASTFVVDVQGVEARIGELFDDLAEPALTDLVASVTGGAVRLYPDPVPDLYAGRPVMLLGRLSGAAREIVVTGRRDGMRWRRAFALPEAGPAASGGADAVDDPGVDPGVDPIAGRWAALRIEHLLDEQRIAADPALHRAQILSLALEAQVSSPYTSFVAVSEDVVRPAGERASPAAVANLAPAGTTMRTIAMPRGALGLAGLHRSAAWAAVAAMALAMLAAVAGRAGRRADVRRA